jgi:sporulation protein YlmC with PRC-barrel domain
MVKLLATTAVSALLMSVALAQTPSSNTFVPAQHAGYMRTSKLIGSTVYGPGDTNIGNVNEVLVDKDGDIEAVVIGVGGFLGVGEKDVGVRLSALRITPTSSGDNIEKITTSFTKDQLEKAPTFQWGQDPIRK